MSRWSAPRLGGYSALGASALILLSLPLFYVFHPPSPIPLDAPLSAALPSLTAEQHPYWWGQHLVRALFFLLCAGAVWGMHRLLGERGRPLMAPATLAGIAGLAFMVLFHLWRATVELEVARAYLVASPQARPALVALAQRLDMYPLLLNYLGYLVGIWSMLFLLTTLRIRGAMTTLGWLSLAMIPAVGPLPYAGAIWLLPAAWRLLEGRAARSRPGPQGATAPARPKRRGAPARRS